MRGIALGIIAAAFVSAACSAPPPGPPPTATPTAGPFPRLTVTHRTATAVPATPAGVPAATSRIAGEPGVVAARVTALEALDRWVASGTAAEQTPRAAIRQTAAVAFQTPPSTSSSATPSFGRRGPAPRSPAAVAAPALVGAGPSATIRAAFLATRFPAAASPAAEATTRAAVLGAMATWAASGSDAERTPRAALLQTAEPVLLSPVARPTTAVAHPTLASAGVWAPSRRSSAAETVRAIELATWEAQLRTPGAFPWRPPTVTATPPVTPAG